MVQRTSIQQIALLTVPVFVFTTLQIVFNSWLTNILASVALSFTITANILLMGLLLKLWLVPNKPEWFSWYRKLPFYSPKIEVPKHLRPDQGFSSLRQVHNSDNLSFKKQAQPQNRIQKNQGQITESYKIEKYDPSYFDSMLPESDTNQFTLGTLNFELPEPALMPTDYSELPKVPDVEPISFVPDVTINSKVEVVLSKQPRSHGEKNPFQTKFKKDSKAVSSVEKAFVKAASTPKLGIREFKNAENVANGHILKRLHLVLRVMKEASFSMNSWTNKELAILASNYSGEHIKDQDIVALLLPDAILKVSVNRSAEFEHHAQVFRNAMLATQKDMGVKYISSSKDEIRGQCVLRFQQEGEKRTWRFNEPNQELSKKFLSNTMNWVAEQADGRFMQISSNSGQVCYAFMSFDLMERLLVAKPMRAEA